MIYTAIDNFYVTEEQLFDSPSRKDGISMEVETQLRIYGCEVIQEGGILLKLPQAVMATGQVLLHRFYVKESLLKYNIKRVAWACCWLATKLEENPRRIRDLLSVFYRIDRRREGKPLQCLDIYGQEYAIFKRELVNVERHLLRTFGFVLHVDHPHKFVLNYLNILKAGPELKQEAWNLANDSLRTTLAVRFRGETVACGLIFLASRRIQEPLPEDPAWWDLFKIKKEEMYVVAREVHALFAMPKVQYISVYHSNKQLQSPKDSVPPRQGATLSSSVTPTGTPMQYDHDSDTGMSQPLGAGNPGGEGRSMPAAEATVDLEGKKEKRKRSKHEDGLGKRERQYRKKEAELDQDSEVKEEKIGKKSRDIDWNKEMRNREVGRERERVRDREKLDRSRDRDRGREYRDRKRDERDRDRDRV